MFDLKRVTLSHNDRLYGLRLPQSPSEELCEFLGILAGDGSVRKYYNGGSTGREVSVCGHLHDDREYLTYVSKLFTRLFGLVPLRYEARETKTGIIRKGSRGLYQFLLAIGFAKNNCIISVPSWVWDHEDWRISFLRGIFDTDGSVALKKNHGKYKYYPVVNITLKDIDLVKKLHQLCVHTHIASSCFKERTLDRRNGNIYHRRKLQISGYANVGKWMRLVGSNNPKHIRKWHLALKKEKRWDEGDLNSGGLSTGSRHHDG